MSVNQNFAQIETFRPTTIAALHNALRGETPVLVKFTKKNGDGSEAILTWNPALIPAGQKIPPTNKSYVTAWCVGRGRWTTVTFAQLGVFE